MLRKRSLSSFFRFSLKLLPCVALLGIFCLTGCGGQSSSLSASKELPRADTAYTHWLEQQSILTQAERLLAGNRGWSVALPQTAPMDGLDSGLWLHVRAQSLIPSPGRSVLAELMSGDAQLLYRMLELSGLYIDTLNLSGATWQPRRAAIELDTDMTSIAMAEDAGSDQDWQRLAATLNKSNIKLGTALLSPFTGMGPDFLLALQNVRQWPRAYGLINVPRAQWHMLPNLPVVEKGAPPPLTLLSPDAESALRSANLLPAASFGTQKNQLRWAATGESLGYDGVTRRWIYRTLHTPFRPVLYWDDPAAAARRMILGVAQDISNRPGLGMMGVDLAAAVIQDNPETQTLSGVPETVPSILRDLNRCSRNVGRLLVQRDALPLQSLTVQQDAGTDLIFDSTTAPTAEYALLSGDAGPLRNAIDESLLQNLDHSRLLRPLTLPGGADFSAASLDISVLEPFISDWGPTVSMRNGWVQATLPALAAMRAGLAPTPALMAAASENKKKIQPAHELLLKFRGGLPGVLEVSGQDLAGILYSPIDLKDYPELLPFSPVSLPAWTPGETSTPTNGRGVPAGVTVYSTIPKQLSDPESFVHTVAAVSKLRKETGVSRGQVMARLATANPGSIAVLSLLPNGDHLLVVANFANTTLMENLVLPYQADRIKTDMWSGATISGGTVTFKLEPFACRWLRIAK